MERDTNFENHYIADYGKVFQNKENTEIITKSLWIGVNDNIINYIEIDEPIEESEKINENNIDNQE